MSETTKPTSSSRLLALPAELRNEILYHLLLQPQQSSSLSNLTGWPRSPKPPQLDANILLTCKQLHAEGTPILYGENTFCAHPGLLSSLPSLLLATRPYRIALPPVKSARLIPLIKRFYIHVRLDTDPQFSAEQVSASFSGVEVLEVEVFQSMYASCDFGVLRLFEGVRGVGKAVVEGSVGDGVYARWLEEVMMKEPGAQVDVVDGERLGKSVGWEKLDENKRRQLQGV